MTMPAEIISVKCPKCGNIFEGFIRGFINLGLDIFSDEYIERCKFATCPKCGTKISKNVLIVDKEGVINFHYYIYLTLGSRKFAMNIFKNLLF